MAHRNIVIAVDGTAEAHQVVRRAAELLDASCRVTLVTVVDTAFDRYAGLVPVVQRIADEIVRHAEGWLLTLATMHKLDAERVVLHGAPGRRLVDCAADREADLIVIGRHQPNPLRRMLGSTASAVVHNASCDVMLVRVAATAAALDPGEVSSVPPS